jgi:NitT/TauT family transport system permease protein
MKAQLEKIWVRRLLSLAMLTVLWEVCARAGIVNPFYAPAPSEILRVVFTLFAEGTILGHLQATFSAALAGLVIGLALGIVLGFAAALIPLLADILEPIMMLLNAIPRVILAPLFVIWLGIELPSKIALAVVLVAVLIFFAVYSGIRDVNQLLVDRVRTLGGGRLVLLREVYIPSVTAWVLGSLKVAVGFAFTGAVVGEFVAATRGLGYLLQFAQSTYNAALTMGLIFLIMAFVLVLFMGAEAVERRLLRWRYRGADQDDGKQLNHSL